MIRFLTLALFALCCGFTSSAAVDFLCDDPDCYTKGCKASANLIEIPTGGCAIPLINMTMINAHDGYCHCDGDGDGPDGDTQGEADCVWSNQGICSWVGTISFTNPVPGSCLYVGPRQIPPGGTVNAPMNFAPPGCTGGVARTRGALVLAACGVSGIGPCAFTLEFHCASCNFSCACPGD